MLRTFGAIYRAFPLWAVVWAVLLAIATPASADTFGQGFPDHGWQADSSIHTYCYGAGFDATLEDEADHAMNISLDRDTDMSDIFVSSCDSTIDAKWTDANLPPGIYGEYVCTSPYPEPDPGEICFASTLTLDPDAINEGSNDAEDRLQGACHEAGHSVGLRHSDTANDCMLNGEVPDTSAQYRTYSSHHINDHIDLVY